MASGVDPVPTFVHRIRVGWADCDVAKIAYTGRIPYFALEAIDAWWGHQVGQDWFALHLDRNIATPFVHLTFDIYAPTTPRAPLDCHVFLTGLGTTSVTFFVQARQGDTLCFEGTFVCVIVDATSFTKIQRPADIEARIAPLLQPGLVHARAAKNDWDAG